MPLVPQMWEDPRPILSVSTMGDGYASWDVGKLGVTHITPYMENGQEAGVPWLAIYEGDWLVHRVNAAAIESVWYGEEPEKSEATDVVRTA
jgi:hypothetical protein